MATKAYEILARVKDLIGLPSTYTSEDNAILRNINDVQWNIYHAHPRWRALQTTSTLTTTDGQAYVDIPSTLAQLYTLRQTGTSPYDKLTYVPVNKFHETIPQPTEHAEDSPKYYTWWDSKLWLFPIPDATYTLTYYGYSKPVNCKIYTTGTAAHSGTTVTGTSTYFSNNANVDTDMFFAYQGDARSDGTYPWSSISAVSSATAMTISAYAGASGASTVAYACSSALSFSEEFDQLVITMTAIISGTKGREEDKFMSYLYDREAKLLGSLVKSQNFQPDYKPVMEDFSPGRAAKTLFGGVAYNYPFIMRDI